MSRIIHCGAGVMALLLLMSFWLSTAVTELSGSMSWVVWVKCAIPWGLVVLVPALAATGMSGVRLAGGALSPWLARKRRRMAVIAGNGLLILIPCAFTLRYLALEGEFGALFVTVQLLELAAGAVNITLLVLNAREGFLVSRNRHLTAGVQSS